MVRVLKVATPQIGRAACREGRETSPGVGPMATVIEALLLVTVLPKLSWTVTWTAGVMLTPATALLGCVLNTTLVAVLGVMLKAALVPPVSPLLEPFSV